MNKWGFIEWFSIISGAASITSLGIALFVRSQVIKIRGEIKNIENKINSNSTTFGKKSPILTSNEGNITYSSNEREL